MLLTLSNSPRDYSWGSTRLLAELEGREPSGRPEAEVWFGDHPGSPARVGAPGRPGLDAWMDAHRGGVRLPYLLKLLAAGSHLSIQVHPSKAQAEAGFAREEAQGIDRDAPHRNYRDVNHKPEIIVALSDRFDALVGLRELDRTRRILAALPRDPGVEALRAKLAGDDPDVALRETIAWLFTPAATVAVAAVAAALQQPSDALTEALAADENADAGALARIAAAAPGDAGVVVALLMNFVVLRRGEALFTPAGILHAYLAGLGVELMAASDNVLRAGLTPKHIDVAELLEIVDARPSAPVCLESEQMASGVWRYAPGIEDFALTRVELEPGERRMIALPGDGIVLATRGAVEVGVSQSSLLLAPGSAAFVTSDEGSIVLAGQGEAFLAVPGS